MFEMLTGNKLKKMQGHFGQVGCLLAHHFEQVRERERWKEGERDRGRGERERERERLISSSLFMCRSSTVVVVTVTFYLGLLLPHDYQRSEFILCMCMYNVYMYTHAAWKKSS